jgi:ankyrin repeat protein
MLLRLGAAVNACDYAGETAIGRVAGIGSKAVVRELLSGSADISLKTAGNWTVLMSAISGGNNIEIVRILVQGGACLTDETGWGDTALNLATRSGQEDIANYLADAGATLPENAVGRRASVVATQKGLHQLVRRLTINYAAVAHGGLQRQDRAHPGVDLAGIPEVQVES